MANDDTRLSAPSHHSTPDLILIDIRVLYKYRNGLWPMQYVFLIRPSAGGKKYVTRLIC